MDNTDGPCTTKCDSDMDVNEFVEPSYPAAAATDDACIPQFIEIVPLIRYTAGSYTTVCDIGDWSAEVKQEILQQIKEEPDDIPVCDIVTVIKCLTCDNCYISLFYYNCHFPDKFWLTFCLIFFPTHSSEARDFEVGAFRKGRGSTRTGGLGDGSPPAGSSGRAQVGGLGTKSPRS